MTDTALALIKKNGLSSNVDKNTYVQAFKFTLSDLQANSFEVDIDPVENILGENYTYQILKHVKTTMMTNLFIENVATFRTDPNAEYPYHFATVSPILGTYYFFYYFGHIVEDRAFYVRPNMHKEQFKHLDEGQNQFLVRITNKAKEYILFQNIPVFADV